MMTDAKVLAKVGDPSLGLVSKSMLAWYRDHAAGMQASYVIEPMIRPQVLTSM